MISIEPNYKPVGIIFNSCRLVHLDRGQGILHGLVDDRVHGAHEEIERSEKLLTVFGQVPLSLGVVEKFLLEFRGFMSKIGETFTKRILQESSRLMSLTFLDYNGKVGNIFNLCLDHVEEVATQSFRESQNICIFPLSIP